MIQFKKYTTVMGTERFIPVTMKMCPVTRPSACSVYFTTPEHIAEKSILSTVHPVVHYDATATS
jgi:hypothetical protein